MYMPIGVNLPCFLLGVQYAVGWLLTQARKALSELHGGLACPVQHLRPIAVSRRQDDLTLAAAFFSRHPLLVALREMREVTSGGGEIPLTSAEEKLALET